MYMCNKADADGQVRRPLWPDSQLSARVRTMTRRQLRTNVHNSIADTIVCKCSQSGMKWRTLEGIVLVRLLLARLKRKNVTDVYSNTMLCTFCTELKLIAERSFKVFNEHCSCNCKPKNTIQNLRFKTRNLDGYLLLLFLLIWRKCLTTLITAWVHLLQHQHPGHCPHILLRHFYLLSNVFLQSIIVEMFNCTDHIWV